MNGIAEPIAALRIVVIRCQWCAAAQGEAAFSGDMPRGYYWSRCKASRCGKWFKQAWG